LDSHVNLSDKIWNQEKHSLLIAVNYILVINYIMHKTGICTVYVIS